MSNKFWAAPGSDSSSSSGSSDSEDEAPVAQKTDAAPRKQMARWAEESSSDDEVAEKRVVRSHTDKRYEQLMEKIKAIRNHQKIDDFAALTADYETMGKMLDKLKIVVEQDGGPPRKFTKAIIGLEDYVERVHAENLEKKANKGEKLSEAKMRAFNTLRHKIRKGNRQWQEEIDRVKESPESEEEAADEQSGTEGSAAAESSSSSSSSSGSSSSSDSSDSDSSDSDSDSDSDSSSKDKKSWRSGSDDDSDDGDKDEDAVREKKMLRWMITPEDLAKREAKAAKAKEEVDEEKEKKKTKRERKQGNERSGGTEDKKAKEGKEPDEYTPEELIKKVSEIAQQRGRRGFDRKSYEEKLAKMMEHAKKEGPCAQLYVYCTLVSADFDNTGGAFAAMKIEMWNEALKKVRQMLPLIIEVHNAGKEGGNDDEKVETGGEEAEKEEENPASFPRLRELFVAFVEKLDDELYKALQFTVDVYGAEYTDILANSSKFLILLKAVQKYFEDTKQTGHLGTISLRLMEQLYFKPDMLNKAVYEAIQQSKDLSEADKQDFVWPDDSQAYMAKLCSNVFAVKSKDIQSVQAAPVLEGEVDPNEKSCSKLQRRASLCQAYHLALHDRFQSARDLLSLGSLQERAMESDVHTQILYNRVLGQMGLCAFRLGKIQEGHNCLMDVCMHNKARELLAQGLSYSKFHDRTPEQERAERLRQFPYHMHINLEVLDSAHLICAMLLEVPNIAMQSIDPTNKRLISRVLRRALEQHDKQVFVGPPENAKESVVGAAKALQRGDWQSAVAALEDLQIWKHVDPGKPENGTAVKEMIAEKIKIEALRTYLFAYASIYDAFHLDQLVNMFALGPKLVHSIVSKMMIKEEITAFWDETSRFVLMQHSEPTPLQRLSLTLAERGAQAVENNEKLMDQKTGGYGFKEQTGGKGSWQEGGGKGSRFGKGGKGLGKNDGKGKGRGKSTAGPPRNRGWENARAGALRGNAQRGWSTPAKGAW